MRSVALIGLLSALGAVVAFSWPAYHTAFCVG